MDESDGKILFNLNFSVFNIWKVHRTFNFITAQTNAVEIDLAEIDLAESDSDGDEYLTDVEDWTRLKGLIFYEA